MVTTFIECTIGNKVGIIVDYKRVTIFEEVSDRCGDAVACFHNDFIYYIIAGTSFEIFKYSLTDFALKEHIVSNVLSEGLEPWYMFFTKDGNIGLLVNVPYHLKMSMMDFEIRRYSFTSEGFRFKATSAIPNTGSEAKSSFKKDGAYYIEHSKLGLLKYDEENNVMVPSHEKFIIGTFYGKIVRYSHEYIFEDPPSNSEELEQYRSSLQDWSLGITDIGEGCVLIANKVTSKMQISNVTTGYTSTLNIPMCGVLMATVYHF